jgi:hypothetical protein
MGNFLAWVRVVSADAAELAMGRRHDDIAAVLRGGGTRGLGLALAGGIDAPSPRSSRARSRARSFIVILLLYLLSMAAVHGDGVVITQILPGARPIITYGTGDDQ